MVCGYRLHGEEPVKPSHYVAATAVFLVSVGVGGPAFAKNLTETKPYSDFGNLTIGDCGYETDANLILHQFPHATIRTPEVIAAFDPNANGGGNDGFDGTTTPGGMYPVSGLFQAQEYLLSTGFDGHRASTITQVFTKSAIIAGANHGGLSVAIAGPQYDHAFAIFGASKTHVVVENDGYLYHYSWAWFHFIETHTMVPVSPGSTQGKWVANGEELFYYAVTWSTPRTAVGG